jgi:hypothetical protein
MVKSIHDKIAERLATYKNLLLDHRPIILKKST